LFWNKKTEKLKTNEKGKKFNILKHILILVLYIPFKILIME